jgi:hypothetical protein
MGYLLQVAINYSVFFEAHKSIPSSRASRGCAVPLPGMQRGLGASPLRIKGGVLLVFSGRKGIQRGGLLLKPSYPGNQDLQLASEISAATGGAASLTPSLRPPLFHLPLPPIPTPTGQSPIERALLPKHILIFFLTHEHSPRCRGAERGGGGQLGVGPGAVDP